MFWQAKMSTENQELKLKKVKIIKPIKILHNGKQRGWGRKGYAEIIQMCYVYVPTANHECNDYTLLKIYTNKKFRSKQEVKTNKRQKQIACV